MDADIREALADIKHDVREGFTNTNRRIDDLVTRGEFSATVARLDGQHDTLRRRFEGHEAQTESVMEAMRRADMNVMTASKDEVTKLRTEVLADLESFRVTSRWAIGLAASATGVLVALLSWLLKII